MSRYAAANECPPCVKCGRPAFFKSPSDWCAHHWAKWWCEGVYGSRWRFDREAIKLYYEILNDVGEIVCIGRVID